MNIFKRKKFEKLRTKFDYSTLDIPTSEEVKEILNEYITPFVSEFGLDKWNGKYQWYGNFNKNGIKPVFEFANMKGISGTLEFGNCFYFLPTISNSQKLLNHRTEKSTKLHLFDSTYRYSDYNPNDLISLHNKKEFIKTLIKALNKYKPVIQKWYENNITIKENIETAKIQLIEEKGFSINSPSQEYVLSFLYMQIGEQNEAERQMNNFIMRHNNYLSEEVKERLIEKIKNRC